MPAEETMTKAEKILKKKDSIRAELDKAVPGPQSAELWREAAERLDSMLERYSGLPKGVRMHTDNYIFPSAAIYMTAQERIGQPAAYRVIEDAETKNTKALGRKLASMMRLPGMPAFFVNVWDPVSHIMFGSDNGFRNVFYPKTKGEFRMDITACPYCRYFTELGCPELTKIFCDNDERTYGDLPGILFKRTGTLGKGAARCDFYLKKL